MTITIKTNADAVTRDARNRLTAQMRRDTAAAINKALPAARDASVKAMTNTYAITKSVLYKSFVLQLATPQTQRASIIVSGKRQSLMMFKPQQTAQGVTVNIKGARKLIPSAFILTRQKTPYDGVFVRKGRSRHPIQKLYTISVPGMFLSEPVQLALDKAAIDEFDRRLTETNQYNVK